MTYSKTNPMIIADILALIAPELRRKEAGPDLQTRLAQLGFAVQDTPDGKVLTTLPHGLPIAPLPAATVA